MAQNKYLERNLSYLVGGFNPSEKYLSKWIISQGRGENKKIFETTTQLFTLPTDENEADRSHVSRR